MKEQVVLPAWELITKFHSLKKLNFIPSLFGMLWLFLILIYQITFTYVYVFQKKDEILSTLASFAHKEYFGEVLTSLIVIFLLYTILEPIALGGIVQMIDSYRKSNGEKPHRTFQGIFDGLRHFLPLFEVQNLTAVFRPLSVITFYILLLRIFGVTFFTSITVIMGIYLFLAFFLNMCFAYSKFFIIFEGKSALESLSLSTGLTVRHINITGRLYFTMILLYFRTIIVALLFLVLPFIISSTIAFIAPIFSVKIILFIIFGIVSLIFFIFIVHLNSTLEIFIEATWYEAYKLCKKEDAEYGISHSDGHESSDHHDKHGHDEHHDNHEHGERH